MPKISVIVPVYNVEKYLRQCVESILNQTFRDFELILVDDGSPDRCGEICDEYAFSDSRVKVIHQSNGGLSAARNAGLDVASGGFLAFVDSDDYIRQEMLEILYSSAVTNNADLVVCNFERVSDDGIPVVDYTVCQFPPKDGTYSNKIAIKGLSSTDSYFWVVTWNKLYRRELFTDLSFPEGKVNEGMFTMHEIFYGCARVYVVNQKLYLYRDNPNSTIHNKNAHFWLCNEEGRISRLKFYEKNNMVEDIEDNMDKLLFLYYSNILSIKEFTETSQKKRFLKLKKDIRHFFYKYKKNVSLMEKFYFETPKLFSFLKNIQRRLTKQRR